MDNESWVSHKNVLWYIYRALADEMFPIKDGLYSVVDLCVQENDSVDQRNYKNLMNKEFSFCIKILPLIIQKANKLYSKQIETRHVTKFCCDFKLLEEKCRDYPVN